MRLFLSLVLVATIAERADAREVYVVGGVADGAATHYCRWINWDSDALFYNSGYAPATVRLLNVSNGYLEDSVDSAFVVPPRTVLPVDARLRPSGGNIPIWVWTFEVPDSVKVTSFLELREKNCVFPEPRAMRGQITLPVFDRLIPPGEEQALLGTDLGDRDRRINVAIYNAGSAPATAQITVRRVCDGVPLGSDTFLIPPNTAIQKGTVHSGVVPYGNCGQISARGTYVTVLVDQPSVSWASTLANDEATSVTLDVVP